MEKCDVHNYARRYELALKKIKNSNLSDATKNLLEKFCEHCVTEGLEIPTTLKHLFGLQNVARWAEKDLDKTDKNDIENIVNKLEKSHYSSHVKHAIKVSIKKFYKWQNGGQDYPDKVKWIKSTPKTKHHLPEELLTEEDVEKLVNSAEHLRDKALVSMLYDSGCRIGEILSLRLKHVIFDEYGAKITLNGKTGMRVIRLISAAPQLAAWYENHPKRDDPESPLWVGIGSKRRGEQIFYKDVRFFIHKLAKKAGIKKRVHPHLFRHSRATELANHLTEAQMNHHFGWVQGSDMPATYVHMSLRDVDDAFLRIYGYKKKEITEKENLPPKKCHRCEKMNPPTGKYCLRCGAPLSVEAAIRIEEKWNEANGPMRALLNDPEVIDLLISKMKQMNIGLDQPSVK